MSDTYGALYIQGQQINLPGGGIQGIGTFAIPCSGVQNTVSVVSGDSVTVPVPAGAAGVIIIAQANANASVQVKTVPGDQGTYISFTQPSVLTFDPNRVPANIYIATGATITMTLQFF